MNQPASGRFLRLLRAAIVLAVIYTLGVAAFFVLLAFLGAWELFVEGLWSIVAPLGILFGLAFVVLAFVRRAGFVLLWVILLALWIWMLFGPVLGQISMLLSYGVGHPFRFVAWSVLALPLFLIGLMATGRAIVIKLGRWVVSPVFAVGVWWVSLAIVGFLLRDYGHPHYPWSSDTSWVTLAILGWVLWAPTPIAITGLSIAAIWISSRTGKLLEAEQPGTWVTE